MSAIHTVVSAYSRAWPSRVAMISTVLTFRLIGLAILTPAVGLLINLAVSLSNQSALTDQDIARFLLTPVGSIVALGVLATMAVISVLSFALLTLVIHNGQSETFEALRSNAGILIGRLRALFIYALLLILRVIAIAAPFVVVGLIVAKRYLTEFDINYYLSNRPPDFYVAASIIAVVVAVLAILLLNRLLSWAVSLHMVLFDQTSPNKAFGDSARLMKGHRLTILGQVVIWLAFRLAIASLIALIVGIVVRTISSDSDSLKSVLLVVIVAVSLWSLAGVVLASISNGALACLLNDRFDPERVHAKGNPNEVPVSLSYRWMAAGVLVVCGLGIASGMALIDRLQTDDNVQIIAHRGAAGDRPENTMASVHKALDDGADWIEIDVQETADNQVVVVHDSDFMKLSLVDLKVWDATMGDLASIDIGSWFDPEFAEERTPLLRDVLLAAKGKSKVLIELKYYGHDVDLENRVAKIVEATDMTANIATMSLKYPAVEKMKALRPEWQSGVLAATAIGNLAKLDADFVAVSGASLSQSLIDAVHNEGKDIYVWTINDPLDMSNMMSRGVDGIITDEPALARTVLEIRADLSTPQRFLLLLADIFGVQLNTADYRDASP
jgi:glycerophosphoryl diester phosphodiesterase